MKRDDLDPRHGEGRVLADKLWTVYRKAYDKSAGPERFRHSVNHDTYHRFALIGVYEFVKQGELEDER